MGYGQKYFFNLMMRAHTENIGFSAPIAMLFIPLFDFPKNSGLTSIFFQKILNAPLLGLFSGK